MDLPAWPPASVLQRMTWCHQRNAGAGRPRGVWDAGNDGLRVPRVWGQDNQMGMFSRGPATPCVLGERCFLLCIPGSEADSRCCEGARLDEAQA